MMVQTVRPIGDGDHKRELEKLSALLEITQKISAELDLKKLLNLIAQKTSWLLNADRSSVYLVDDEKNEIWTFVGEGLGSTVVRLPVGVGIAGTVAKTGETLNIVNCYDHPLFEPSWDKKTGYYTQTMLTMPMHNKRGDMIGVFQVINKLDGNIFLPEDEQLLLAFASTASVAIENALLYEEQKRQFNSFIEVLAASVDAKDPTTADHSKRVTGIAVSIAKELTLSEKEVEKVRISATLHDYGKIGIPDNILGKPSSLSPEETKVMKSHAALTIEILSKIYFVKELRDVPSLAGMHHERLDGTGYPNALRNGEIPVIGRILAVADIFQALMQSRPYKPALSAEDALRECEKLTHPHAGRFGDQEGIHLDVNVVSALRSVLEKNNWDDSVFLRESGWSL